MIYFEKCPKCSSLDVVATDHTAHETGRIVYYECQTCSTRWQSWEVYA